MAGLLGLAVACVVVALTLAEGVVAARGWDHVPIRARPGLDREMVRSEFSVRVVTNALGFREPRLPAPKAPGTVRIVVVGDSFTQGYGVAEEQAYPRRLEALLRARADDPRYEVVNLGVPGACPLDYVHHVRDPGLAYEPDVVVVGLMANDVHDVHLLRRDRVRGALELVKAVRAEMYETPAWRRLARKAWPALHDVAGRTLATLRPRQALESRGEAARAGAASPAEWAWRDVLLEIAERQGRRTEVAQALDELAPHEQAMLRDVITGAWQIEEHVDQTPAYLLRRIVAPRAHLDAVLLGDEYEDAWRETTEALREIDRVARAAGARTVIVFIPAGHQVNDASDGFFARLGFPTDARTLQDRTFADRVERFGAEHGIAVVDLLAPLGERAAEPLYFVEDRHWTPLGHAVAADTLAGAVSWPRPGGARESVRRGHGAASRLAPAS